MKMERKIESYVQEGSFLERKLLPYLFQGEKKFPSPTDRLSQINHK